MLMTNKSILLGTVATTLLALASTATTSLAAGTDILHFSDRANFSGDGGASGTVFARENKQGKADNQSVSISLKGLDTNAPYTLLISTVDDTNLVSATDFTTDKRGKASLTLKKTGKGNNKNALPDVMQPVAELRSFAVVNADTQTVATADLTAPTQLQYQIKRDLSTNDITATLRIQATTKKTKLRVSARGLPAASDFSLVLNDAVAATDTTDSHGKLEMATELVNPNDILDLRSVVVMDTSSNVVLSTTLP